MNTSSLTLKMPPIPGNGKGVVGLSFDNQLLFGLAAVLLLFRVLTTLSSLWAGAEGGLLTPGLANGALMAVLLGCVWNMFWPSTAVGGLCDCRSDCIFGLPHADALDCRDAHA